MARKSQKPDVLKGVSVLKKSTGELEEMQQELGKIIQARRDEEERKIREREERRRGIIVDFMAELLRAGDEEATRIFKRMKEGLSEDDKRLFDDFPPAPPAPPANSEKAKKGKAKKGKAKKEEVGGAEPGPESAPGQSEKADVVPDSGSEFGAAGAGAQGAKTGPASAPKCPECGKTLTLKEVGTDSQRRSLWACFNSDHHSDGKNKWYKLDEHGAPIFS